MLSEDEQGGKTLPATETYPVCSHTTHLSQTTWSFLIFTAVLDVNVTWSSEFLSVCMTATHLFSRSKSCSKRLSTTCKETAFLWWLCSSGCPGLLTFSSSVGDYPLRDWKKKSRRARGQAIEVAGRSSRPQ